MYAGQSVEDLALPEPIQQPVQHNHHRHLAVNRPINSVYSQYRGQQDNNNKLGRYKEFSKRPEGICTTISSRVCRPSGGHSEPPLPWSWACSPLERETSILAHSTPPPLTHWSLVGVRGEEEGERILCPA